MWDNPTFETVSKEFETREHALNWIIENQLGRRNLNPNQIAYLRGKRYECEKKIVSNEKGYNQHNREVGSQFEHQPKLPKTNENLAKQYGVGKSTISRNAKFSKVVDILPDQTKKEVLSGGSSIPHSYVNEIIDMPKPIQTKFIKEVEKGTPIKEAVRKVDPEAKEVDILRFEYNTLSLYQRNG